VSAPQVLRVLYRGRLDALDTIGGDTIQMIHLARHLRRLGVDVAISTEATPDLTGFDIVHLFNVTSAVWARGQLRAAQRRGRRVVISPIYWDEREMMWRVFTRLLAEGDFVGLMLGVREWMRRRRVESGSARNPIAPARYASLQRETLLRCDRILPNSRIECWLIQNRFGIDPRKTRVVYNGVEHTYLEGTQSPLRTIPPNAVLMVARFDQRKNQLGLIRALRGTGLRPVFVGGPVMHSRLSEHYYQRCRREGGREAIFLGWVKHEALGYLYQNCWVHTLPSAYETPGLSSLEAAMWGANIVSTNRGSAVEYFGDQAWYCDPFDVSSIRAAVTEAYRAPRSAVLAERIRTQFSWASAARTTLEVYRDLLDDQTVD